MLNRHRALNECALRVLQARAIRTRRSCFTCPCTPHVSSTKTSTTSQVRNEIHSAHSRLPLMLVVISESCGCACVAAYRKLIKEAIYEVTHSYPFWNRSAGLILHFTC